MGGNLSPLTLLNAGGHVYQGSLETSRVINAFQRAVPDTYIRDYRENGGYIVIARNYRTIKWADGQSTQRVEKAVPAITLVNLPAGYITAADRYNGLRLDRPGWRSQFRKAAKHLSEGQMRRITKDLRAGEVFPGIR